MAENPLATVEEAREALERAEKATPGPWWNETHVIHAKGPEWTPEHHSCIHPASTPLLGENSWEDAEFTAAARTDVPKLANTVIAQDKRIERMRKTLEWYADKKRYVATKIDADSMGMHSPAVADGGGRAREAVKELGMEATTDAVEILHDRYVGDDPALLAALGAERRKADIAQKVYDLRTNAGLTQQQLAEQIAGTEQDIVDLEAGYFEGDASPLLLRIVNALENPE